MLRMTGTRMVGCVLRQNDRIETTMKNTDTIDVTCIVQRQPKQNVTKILQVLSPFCHWKNMFYCFLGHLIITTVGLYLAAYFKVME